MISKNIKKIFGIKSINNFIYNQNTSINNLQVIKKHREEIFKVLKSKLVIENKNIELNWCEKLENLIELSENSHFGKDLYFLNFGTCLIFGGLEIKLSTSKLTNSGKTLTEVGGALNTNEEAKELHKKLEDILGVADFYSETYDEIYTYWEDKNSKVIIYPRHHMGGEWFEYKIITKNCTSYAKSLDFVPTHKDINYQSTFTSTGSVTVNYSYLT